MRAVHGWIADGDRGFTAIELIVVLIVAGIMIALAMPALSGYQATTAMWTAARQFASDVRAAQQVAESRSTTIDMCLTQSGGAVTGYTVQQGGTVLWQTTLPTRAHATSHWPTGAQCSSSPDIAFAASGAVTGPGAVPALCVDTGGGITSSLMVTVGVTVATGRANISSQAVGGCS